MKPDPTSRPLLTQPPPGWTHLFDRLPVPTGIANAEGLWIATNDRLNALLAHPDSSLTGTQVASHLAPEFHPWWLNQLAALTTHNTPAHRSNIQLLLPNNQSIRAKVLIAPTENDPSSPPSLLIQIVNLEPALKTHDALVAESERWKTAAESAELGIFDWDGTTNEIYFSPAYKRNLGYSPDQWSNNAIEWESRIHPDDLENTLRISRSIANPEVNSFEMEYRLRHRDGSYRWVIDRGCVFKRDANGTPLRVIGAHLDITQRKTAEEKLSRNENALRIILDHLPCPVAVNELDELGTFSFINHRFTELFGYRIGDFHTVPEWLNLAFPDPEQRQHTTNWFQDILQCAATGQQPARAGELQITARNGNIVIVDVHATIFHDQVIVSCHDVTERSHATNTIREVYQKMKLAADAANLGFWEYDITHNRQLWDDRMFHVYGVNPVDYFGGPVEFEKLVHPDDRSPTLATIEQKILSPTETGFQQEFRIVRPDGEVRHLRSVAAILRDPNGKATRLTGLDQDVTHERLTELRLRRSQTSLQHILDNLPIPVSGATLSLWSPIESRAFFLNRQFTATFGYTLDDIPTIDAWAKLAYPDPAYRNSVMNWWLEAIQQAVERNGTVESAEFKVTAKDGSSHDVIFHSTVVDQVVITTMEDLTNRNKVQAELEEIRNDLEKRALELTRHIPVGTYVTLESSSSQPIFTFVSDRWLEMLGLDRDEVIQDPSITLRIVHPEDIGSLLFERKRATDSKSTFSWEGRLKTPSGYRWFHIESVPRLHPEGYYIREGVLTDITRRHQAEQNQLATENRLRKIIQNLPVPVISLRIPPDGSLPSVNRQYIDAYGYTPEDIPDVETLEQLVFPNPTYRRKIQQWWRKEFSKATKHEGLIGPKEIHITAKDGSTRHTVFTAILTEGILVASVQDITQRKQAEITLAQALETEKLLRSEAEDARALAERATQAKSLFLANVSHEIRTPLSALIALSRALWLDNEQRELDAHLADSLNRIRSGGQYLDLLLNNLLNVASIESGRAPIHPQTFYLADWLEDVDNLLTPIARSRGIELVWQPLTDEEARFHTDPVRLTQIALNLGHNAVKFSLNPGDRVTITLTLENQTLTLSVSDEGPGIDPERLSLVFEEFQQSKAASASYDRGVGLGLAIVKDNTQLLGGTIHAEPLSPQGIRFTVSLPMLPIETFLPTPP